MSDRKIPKLDRNSDKDDKLIKPIHYLYEDDSNIIIEDNSDIVPIDNKEISMIDIDFNKFKNYDNLSFKKNGENMQISFEQEKLKTTFFEEKSSDSKLFIKGKIEDNTDNTKKQRILNFFNGGIEDEEKIAELVDCTIDYVYKVLRGNK